MSNTCAPSGGANSAKTTLPPPSTEYRKNYDDIFRKNKKKMERGNRAHLRLRKHLGQPEPSTL